MAGTSHIGKAGHLAAMAEFLLRGYNVAMPEVDVGDDIFGGTVQYFSHISPR